jgi:proteasome accessory factor A
MRTPERFRRLHVIVVGDANLGPDSATYLKLGTTAIVLSMIEDGFLAGHDLWPVHPVRQMHAVSHDPTLQHRIELALAQPDRGADCSGKFWLLASKYPAAKLRLGPRAGRADPGRPACLGRHSSIASRPTR